jgi:hypothetical protein
MLEQLNNTVQVFNLSKDGNDLKVNNFKCIHYLED